MPLTPGNNLISDSENTNKTSRRNFSYDPFVGAKVNANEGNFFSGLRDLVTNTAFNVVDSAAFGVPSNLMNKNIEVEEGGFFKRDRRSYGNSWDALGIKPYEELSGAGKFGLGLGQAAGFFVPFSGVSKATKFAQRAAFSNANKLIGEAVETSIKGTVSSNPLRSILKNTVGKQSRQIPHIYRSSPEQYANFSKMLNQNIRKEAADFVQSTGQKVNQSQLDKIADTLVSTLEEMGRSGKFIDDLPDLVSRLGVTFGDNVVSRNAAGAVGRAVDQSINMALYEGLGHITRASFGAQYPDVDYDVLESMKHSAGFAAAITLADFIPGGRKAGAVQDFYKLARKSLNNKRSWTDLYKQNKINDDQLRVLASWFSKQGNISPGGLTTRSLEAGKKNGTALASWMDDVYTNNKKELLTALMRDGGKSLIGSLPRAAVDGLVTATYLNGTENFMDAIHDESMVADYLVGAFMAMRSYQPLDSRKAMRWRYDSTIDARFNFMESMGMDISAIGQNVKAMDMVMHDIDLSARNMETLKSTPDIYNKLFKEREAPAGGETASGSLQERAMADKLVKKFLPVYMNRNDIVSIDAIQDGYNRGTVPNPNSMSDAQFSSLWNDLKDIETSTGKTLEEYTEIGFDRFREDFEAPIAKNHSDMLYRYAAGAADKLGIRISEDDFLRIRDFSDYSDIPEVDFFLRQLVNLEQTGVVQRDKGGKSVSISDKARDPQIREEIKQLADEYLAESSEYFDSSRNYSMHDNPAIDYITEYANLVKRNKLEDAILGRDREGDNDVQSMRREIDAKIGDTVSSKGIEVILEDGNDPARAKQLDRFVNELAEIKRASGKTNTSNRTKKITFDEANDLYKQLEKSDIVHYSEKSDSFYIGNKSMNEFKSDMYEGRMSRSGLDRSDWVVFSLIKEQFGDSGGRVQMPSKELVEGMLRTERSEPRGLDAVTKAEQSGINNLVKDYGDALSRMEKTGLIEKVNSTDTFKDKDINFTEIVNTIKALYAAEAKAEIDDFGKIHSESSKRYNEALKELEVLRSEYEQTGSEKSAQKAQEYVGKYSDVLSSIEDMFGDKKFEQILNQARMMATESAERVDEGEFLNRLFNKDTVDSIARAFDLSRQIANLANIDRAQEGFTPTMARLRSRISEGMRSNVEGIDQMPLEKAFLEYTRDQGYEQSKRLVDELQSSLNRDYNLDTNKMIGDAATKEILDMFRMVSSAEHRGNAQSFVSRLQRLGLNSMLDENNRNLSEDVVNQLKDFDKIKENVISIITDMKANMAFNEYSKHENKIMEEIVSTISTVNRRTSEYNTFTIRGESLVFDNSHSTVMTPLGEFTRNAGFSTTIVKSTSLDIDGNVEHITDLTLNQVQEKIDAAHQRIIKKAVAGEIEDPESLFRMFGRRENISESQHALFVPLQANENVGVLVPRSDENIKLLKSEFNAFTKSIMDEANKRGQSEALGYHLDVMNDLLSKNNSDGISAAVRSMYYYKNISKDMFWQMIGEGKTKGEVYESSRAAQIKNFKYIHHVNSENAMSYDSRTLRMITDAIGVFDTKNVDTKAIAHINKRADEGVNVFVFDDETVDSQGNRIVGTTAYDIIGRTIDAKLDQMNIPDSQRAEMRERLIVRTGRDYGMGTDAESLKQSTLDGVTFASEDAMRADALLMGASFDAGVTAAKMQFHDPNKSLIGKTAVRYEPSLAKFMKDNGIDYIIPASSAKSWEGKKDVVKTESWNNQQSIGENISQFSGRIDNISMKNFPAESVKYLYATHGGENVRSNTNTSTMHFINEQGIKDYNKQLNIDQIVGTISRLASNAQSNYFAGGLEGFFKGKYNDSDKHFSHYSAIEQLIDWNIDSQNSLVKDPVMRMLKDSLYNSLLVQKRTDIVNTFLFTDSRLKSPIYDGSDKIGYVKSFGEVRIPDAKRNEGTDANTTIAFTLNRDNDFQDYLLNGEEVSTPNRGADVKYLDDVKDSLKLLWSDVVDQGTYGASHDRLQEINMALRGQITQDGRPVIYDIDVNKKGEILGRTVSKEITEAVVKLKEAGINNLSLVVNSHKIPKKFAADSIVNRLEGFVDREKGNIIEANNYEVALQHQADQDGDKLVSYMKMPYSVLQSSMYNMALAKDAPTVAPKETPFPNVFGSLTDDRTFTKPNDTASSRTNNPLRYMASERKSKYVVGTTVKVQGTSTLMDLANIKFNGEPIMSFGNTSDADFVKASDFARITGSITQSILDAWKGVHDSLLKQQQIKDYILFGDRGNIPIEAINKTSTGDEGFNGIFNVRYDPNTSRGRVYRDYVREVYNAFEGVYTVFGDTYEGGVATKPEFHHLASTYYRLKGIFSRDNDYLFTRLLAKYNRNNRSADANELRNIFENKDQLEGTRSLKDVFAFDTTFENLIDNHPQLKALHHVVQAGDFSKDTDFAIHRNPLVEEMFGKGDTGAMAKMASVRGDRVFSESLIINDEAVSKLVKSFNQDKFGNIPADAPKKLGLFNHVINNKINQLDYSKNFYKKIGNLEMVEDIKQEIRVLRNQQREVQNKIYKNHIEGVETGKFYDGVDDFNNSLKKDPSKNTPVHIYKVSKTNSGDEYFDFYKVLKPGERLPTYFKGKFVALLNPIEITPTNSKDSIEGMSMELATSDYYYNIEGAVGNKTRADKAVNDARRVVERAKHQLREINSDTFDLTKEMPAIKSEIYDDNSAYSSIVINRMLDDIRKLENDYGIEKVDMLRLALSPRALPNSVVKDSGQLLNNFKIDRKFSLAIIKHINDNKHFKTAEYFPALSKIMESYGDNMMVSKGLTRSSMHAVDNSSISNRRDQYMAIANDKGNSLMQSLTRMAKDDILLRESIKRFDTPRERVNRDGTIDYTAKEARKNNEPDKGCRII